MANQYFGLDFHDGQAFVRIYPATDGGELLNIKEVTSYLEKKNYKNFDNKQLNAALQHSDTEQEVPIGAWDGIEVAEMMDIDISRDKMEVVCRFYPASPNGRVLNAKDIVESLAFRKIKYGFDQMEVYHFLQNREYCRDYVFVKGLEPVHGKDAYVEYFFNTDRDLKPKHNADGSVDYKELNTISHVTEGQLLARLVPEDPGTPGKNVFGDIVKPRNVKTARLEFGSNITVSEDGSELYSQVNGHASLYNKKVFVSNVYEVPADVDNSTGNIDYEGNVLVHGNVKTGFSVHASGDIIVEGVVEGAELYAEGQIIVKQGIHGMFKGLIYAGTHLISKYIESATVTSGGYIEAEIILNSDVSAKKYIGVHGKKGLINGGTLRAGEYIEADNVGTEMGTATLLEVGVEPEKKERYIELSKEFDGLSKEMDDNKLIIDNYSAIIKKGEHLPKDKIAYMQKLAQTYKEQLVQSENLKKEMDIIHEEMTASNNSFVVVNRTIYPGVRVVISDLSYSVNDKHSLCRFRKMEGDIRICAL
jgi:hypothetical protein